MGERLDNFKEKVSDWYNDGDQFYLRTVVDPIIDLGKEIGKLGPFVAEYATPFYSDIQAGADVLEGGINDFQNGNYVSGAVKTVASVPVSLLSLMSVDGADLPLKTAAKQLKHQPLQVYTAKTLGGKAGRGRPASAINENTGKPITKYDIVEALRDFLSPNKQVSADVVKKANQEATVRYADKKAMNKVKNFGETRMNMTEKRSGHAPVKSVGKQVTQYDAELLTRDFTWQASPLGRTRADGIIQQNWNLFLENAKKLGFDTKSKDSIKELEIIFNTTYQRFFKKHGGILNYSTYFS